MTPVTIIQARSEKTALMALYGIAVGQTATMTGVKPLLTRLMMIMTLRDLSGTEMFDVLKFSDNNT